jgi:DTW domain-containing protein YfiP
MGDQTTPAAASSQPFSSNRSKEQSTPEATVLPGKWEQVLHLWQCGPLCQELPKESVEADASTKSRQRKEAEGAS